MKFLVYNILFGFIKTYGEFLLCEQFITLLYGVSIKKDNARTKDNPGTQKR